MNTAPGGDAMTVRYNRDAEAAALKHAKVRRPIAWTIHPADAAECAAKGEHCQTRRCRNPVAVVTWRFWRSAEVGRVLLAEHMVCVDHGREFADRHGIEIEPPPDEPSRARGEIHYIHKGCDGTILWDLSGGFCLTCHAEGLDMEDVRPGEAGPR